MASIELFEYTRPLTPQTSRRMHECSPNLRQSWLWVGYYVNSYTTELGIVIKNDSKAHSTGPASIKWLETHIHTCTVHATLGSWVPGSQVLGSADPRSSGPLNIDNRYSLVFEVIAHLPVPLSPSSTQSFLVANSSTNLWCRPHVATRALIHFYFLILKAMYGHTILSAKKKKHVSAAMLCNFGNKSAISFATLLLREREIFRICLLE